MKNISKKKKLSIDASSIQKKTNCIHLNFNQYTLDSKFQDEEIGEKHIYIYLSIGSSMSKISNLIVVSKIKLQLKLSMRHKK
jgi:hypothetical protein